LFLGILLASVGGAEPESNWALRAVARPAVPQTRNPHSEYCNPIDAFLLARLQRDGLSFAPPADRATLIRRATFDLHGLPPTPEEIAAFVNDPRPDAYERLIDRLLASPRYGERWSRHWLDVARFAESQGFERDKIRDHAWRYRDYVIKSFNDDKPYDRFVREQIAGDLMPESGRDGVIATGFLVAGPYDEAGNSSVSVMLKARIREEELEDMIGTVSQTFLGLTVNCARCHDHKFDPIPQRDYYRIKSVFEAVRHGDRSILTIAEERQRRGESARLEAEIQSRLQSLRTLESTARGAKPASGPVPISRWAFNGDARDSVGNLHGTLHGPAVIRNGRLVLNGQGAYVTTPPLSRDLGEKTLEAWIALPNLDQRGGAAISVQTPDGATFDAIVFGERQPRRWMAGSEFFRRSRDHDAPSESAAPKDLVHVAVVYAADDRITIYRNGKLYAGPYRPEGDGSKLRTYHAGAAQVLFGLRHTGAGNGFLTGEIDEARLYDRALSAEQVEASFRAGPASMSADEIRKALSPEERKKWEALRSEVDELRRRVDRLGAVPLGYVANPKPAPPTAVLLRGDFEKKGEVVAAGGLSKLPGSDFGLTSDAPEAGRRLRFANWVTDPANSLTARVIVNRLWQYHFGRGIVETPNDFGASGGRPSHPELLDWLADEFRSRGWSIKQMHRLIMLSAAYRQSSRFDPNAAAIDADDRLLWRFAPRRLEAEEIRDAMLAVSGRLNPVMGGPGFQPFKITVFNSTFYDLIDDDRPAFNRRTIYRIGVNSAKDPLLESLDCPEPSVKAPRRSVTTTPIQALGLMNNPFVQRQAKLMAKRLESERDPIARAYSLAFGRAPTPAERERAEGLIREHGLQSVCWVLLNASEFLYVK
jgi:hypothetical protein